MNLWLASRCSGLALRPLAPQFTFRGNADLPLARQEVCLMALYALAWALNLVGLQCRQWCQDQQYQEPSPCYRTW